MRKPTKYDVLSKLQYKATKASKEFCEKYPELTETVEANNLMVVYEEMKTLLKPKYPKVQFFYKIIIGEPDDPYLIRWNIIGCKWFTLRLHKFCRSDHDCLHDHPWNFWVIILKGGYFEKTQDGVRWKKPGSLLYRPAEWRHSVQLPVKDRKLGSEITHYSSWSLVLSFKPIRQWGFWQNGIWTHWTKFNATNKCD